MKYSIEIFDKKNYKKIRRHLLKDRTKEQMVILLCGVIKTKNKIRFIVRYVIILPCDAFVYQSSIGLELKTEINQYILKLCKKENLSQIDIHSHPGNSNNIDFSGIDDQHEKKLCLYLNQKIPNTYYGSVVMNEKSMKARIVLKDSFQEITEIKVGLNNVLETSKSTDAKEYLIGRFNRQVLAFGAGLQNKLQGLAVGIVGLGGLGSILTELLTRLGIRNFVLIDNDVIEGSNLNRVTASTSKDAGNKTLKVEVAKRNILSIDPQANVIALQKSVFDKDVIEHLKSCNIIIACTDNHSSRLFLNRFCHQYLITLIHLGVNIDVNKKGKITDISGEFVIIEPGQQGFCLQCAGIINPQQASWETASDFEKVNLINRGYIKDIPAPAVYHLNSTIASIACAEIHNYIYPYKPLRKYLTYNALTSELMEIKVKPNKKCLICSSKGILGLGDLEPLPDFSRKPTIPASAKNQSEKEGEKDGTK